MLSGVVGKAGLYGLLRIAIPKFPTVVHDWRDVFLVLASISLIYGSLLAFRAPDFRGVVAYSSMAQAGLIVLGLFANNSLGYDGAVLQIVNHGLVSASLFLLAGMVERRTSTGEFALLGGMARGRPALATLVMTVGVISLAVPLSTTFAGEFLILAGVFQQGWAWAVIGAVAIVLAAMYMLRAISAVLHQDVGSAVSERATDLRLGELAILVPLVLCLLGLSAWPNLITSRAFGGGKPEQQIAAGLDVTRVAHATVSSDGSFSIFEPGDATAAQIANSLFIDNGGVYEGTGTVVYRSAASDREAARRLVRARADPLAARSLGRAADGGCLRAGEDAPRGRRVRRLRRVRRGRHLGGLPRREDRRRRVLLVHDAMVRDRWGSVAQVILAGCGAIAVLIAYRERMRDEHVAEYYALLTAAGAGMMFFVQAANLMTLFLALEWFSIALYVLTAIDIELVGSLEAGLKYLIVGAVGSATLLFGSALVYGVTGQLSFDKIAAAGHPHDAMLVVGLAMIIVGFAFKASAAPFHMWTPDAYQGAPTPVTSFMSSATKVAALVVMYRVLVTAFPHDQGLWRWAIAIIACVSLVWGNVAALAQRNVKRILAYSSVSHAGFMLIAVAAGEPARRASAHLLPDPVLGDVARRLRRRRGARARARDAGDASEPRRLRLGATVPRRRDVDVHARDARLPADRRLHRQVLRLRRRVRPRLLVADRRRCRRHDDLGLLLPRHRPGDVLPRLGRAAARARPAARRRSTRSSSLGVGLALFVTVGSFFAVQPLIDVAHAAANSLPPLP